MKTVLAFLMMLSVTARADYWTRKADFPGLKRNNAFSFGIGDKGYICCGSSFGGVKFSDLWEYNSVNGNWSQKTSFPIATSFTGTDVCINIGNKGYVLLQDGKLFEYDVSSNSWQQKKSIPVADVNVGFTAGNRGYFSGYNFREYDPVTDNWSIKTTFPGGLRWAPMAFTIGPYGYLGGGQEMVTPHDYKKEFWQYDPAFDSWKQIADFGGGPRAMAYSFSTAFRGYAIEGFGGNNWFMDLWEYNPNNNIWSRKADFPGRNMMGASAFCAGGKGYIGLGDTVLAGTENNYSTTAFWEYTPDSTTDISEATIISDFILSPNPAHQSLNISFPHRFNDLSITIMDINGKNVFSLSPAQSVIDVYNLSPGVYFLEMNDGRESVVRRFLKE